MKYLVYKTGAEKFDALHAYGLAILIAHASSREVDLEDCGYAYQLECDTLEPKETSLDILGKVLQCPPTNEICNIGPLHEVPNEVKNFDGLLATYFTVRGVRVASVEDLRQKQRFSKTSIELANSKVNDAINRLRKFVLITAIDPSKWLLELCREYEPSRPKVPIPFRAVNPALTLLSTIDPIFGISTRQTLSDGRVERRYNLGILGTTFAVLLAIIGASRFLRAHRVTNDRINFYVPLARSLKINSEFSLAPLRTSDKSFQQALLAQWLYFWHYGPTGTWSGLSYQVFQQQGLMQSISVDRGALGFGYLRQLVDASEQKLTSYWSNLLKTAQRDEPFKIDHLQDFLMTGKDSAWLGHLDDVARSTHGDFWSNKEIYSLEQVRRVSMMTIPKPNSPLGKILEREDGTLRFGRALRLLGRYRPASLKDIISELDTATSRDDLICALTHAVQECVVATSKTKFMVVPNETDFLVLLSDIDEYSPRSIARVLIILSALRYPRNGVSEFEAGEIATNSSGEIDS